MNWEKITLIGVGLLGGSLGLAAKRIPLASQITGYVRRQASVEECLSHEVADHATLNLAEAVTDADLLVLCTPISQMRSLTEQMLPHLKAGAIVTDVGSVKRTVVEEIEPLVSKANAHFVGSHPMAGAEKTGVKYARHDLFASSICAITPTSKSNANAVDKVTRFWRALGAQVLSISPTTHDDLVSRSSHLPHMVAAALVNDILGTDDPSGQQQQLCGPGFKDTTRVASGSPAMWRDIAFANRDFLSAQLKSLGEQIDTLRAALDDNDPDAVESFLQSAKKRRDDWLCKE